MKKSLEDKLRLAFQAGKERGVYEEKNTYSDEPYNEDEIY